MIPFSKESEEQKLEKIRISKKQGGIVEALKGEILSGNIPVGTEMTQNELAESLGVSRMPVREALILLEYQGLVERLPNNHIKVAELSQEYFTDIFKMCSQLETQALVHWITMNEKESDESFSEEKTTKKESEASGETKEYLLPQKELAFHRMMYELHPFSLQGKLLETMTEIYASFIIENELYNRKQGEEMLVQITDLALSMRNQKITAKKQLELQKAFEQYYAVFPEIMMKVRNEAC